MTSRSARTTRGWLLPARLHLLLLVLLLTTTPMPTTAQEDLAIINVDRPCVSPGDTFATGFEIQGDRNSRSWYWVGLYRTSAVNRLSRREARLEGEPDLWVRSCIYTTCIVVMLWFMVVLEVSFCRFWRRRVCELLYFQSSLTLSKLPFLYPLF